MSKKIRRIRSIRRVSNLERENVKDNIVKVVEARTLHVKSVKSRGWIVGKSKSTKSTETFRTKKEAVTFARDASIKSNSALVIHSKDGRIVESSRNGKVRRK